MAEKIPVSYENVAGTLRPPSGVGRAVVFFASPRSTEEDAAPEFEGEERKPHGHAGEEEIFFKRGREGRWSSTRCRMRGRRVSKNGSDSVHLQVKGAHPEKGTRYRFTRDPVRISDLFLGVTDRSLGTWTILHI